MSEISKQRGRPPKPDAMTAAEQAKRYRARKKTERLNAAVPPQDEANLQAKLVELQMKYDVARHMNVELKNTLAAKQPTSMPKTAKPTRQITEMKKTINELERIVSAYSAEINRLRDELTASHKLAGK